MGMQGYPACYQKPLSKALPFIRELDRMSTFFFQWVYTDLFVVKVWARLSCSRNYGLAVMFAFVNMRALNAEALK